MKLQSPLRTGIRWLGGAAAVAAGAYAAYVGVSWLRYGHVTRPSRDDADSLLDRFMPDYDVVERHHMRVHAPADVTLEAARKTELTEHPLVRAIFKGRELLLGSTPDDRDRPRGLLDAMLAIGWKILDEVPGREIVVGGVTKPWEANVVFRGLPPAEFVSFAEPDYVKIAWTLRADPAGESESIFRTETRAVATDAAARAKFRKYWSFLSPGIIAIRWLSLSPVKANAERRARELVTH